MLPLELLELGWQFSFQTGCWHFIIKTGSETGTRLDFSFGLMVRYDWFVSEHGFEIETNVKFCVTIDALKAITEELLPFGYADFLEEC